MIDEKNDEPEDDDIDPFADFLGEDPEEEKAAVEAAGESAVEEEDSGGDSEQSDDEPVAAAAEKLGEEPEAAKLEEKEEDYSTMERENHALKKKLFTLREKQRIEDQRRRVEEMEAKDEQADEGLDADEVGYWNDEGKFVLDRDKLATQMESTRVQAPVVDSNQDNYETLKTEVAGQYGEEDVTPIVAELEEAYKYLDDEVMKFCKDADIQPAQIGGLPNLLAMMEESGIRSDFEDKYPDINMTDLVVAPTNADLMRSSLKSHIERRRGRPTGEIAGESEAKTVERVPPRERPRSMARKGRARTESEGSSLTDVDPEAIFDMNDEEYAEYEKRSLARMDA